MSDELFEDVVRGETSAGESLDELAPRYETANRAQIELIPTDLEALLPPGHAARLVWSFVQGLDLREFYAVIRAREGRAGRGATDPRILIALWLYATIEGVGSAREVARLCYAHDAYRWLRGGVGINHHTLSDFRVDHQGALDRLLTQSITVLLDQRVVTLNRVTQDGTRVRASAGVRSFRRGERLRECARVARQQVQRVAEMADALNAREVAAQRRAADERLERVQRALAELPAVAETKKRNRSTTEPKASTTDSDARVMKMMDGGYRPAYNVQFATDIDSQAIVGVAVTNVGSDQGQLVPMLDQVVRRTGRAPKTQLADAGFVSTEAIEAAATRNVTLLMPVPKKNAPGSGTEAGKSAAVTAWRDRMAGEEAQRLYRSRAGTAERINADVRTHRTLTQLSVRGLSKVLTWALWVALAQNAMRAMGIVPHLMT